VAISLCRYPGGKNALARPILERINNKLQLEYREPFFGGGSIGLRVAATGGARIWINDKDPTVFALWKAVAEHPVELKRALMETKASVEEFDRIKARFLDWARGIIPLSSIVQVARDKLLLQAISYNGLGVMASGPFGGRSQSERKVEDRWHPASICKRVDAISIDLSRAKITNSDFADMLRDDGRVSIYLDPPYWKAGPQLYQHTFTIADHLRLRELLRHSDHDWVLSYDDCEEIRELYAFTHIDELRVTYRNGKSHRRTHELLITAPQRNRTFVALAA
jgi:DNA adenine methylase